MVGEIDYDAYALELEAYIAENYSGVIVDEQMKRNAASTILQPELDSGNISAGAYEECCIQLASLV